MTPAFGFSVGDFISAIGLVKRVTKALKEAGGASSEYQLVVIELKGLKSILRHLETLQPTEDNVSHINAVRGMALACQLPLRDFMVKLEKYESTLGPLADKRSLRAIGKKSKWAVVFAEEVVRLRAMVAAKNISLNLLLAMNTSHILSRMDSRNQEKHGDLMSKAAEHRAALHKVQDGIFQIEDKMSRAGAAFDRRLDGIENDMSQAKKASSRCLDEISAKVGDTQTSVMSLRSTGEQILNFLRTFPMEMRELLENILRANWQTYQVLLRIQQSTIRSPTGLLESNIRFEDALGEYRELPYEFFRHWEPFEGFIRAQFKNKLGERKVIEGQYHIIHAGNDRSIIKKEHWTRSIEQGAKLKMSMVMFHLQRRANFCPRPSCSGGGLSQCRTSALLTCKVCNLKFFPPLDDLGVSSSRFEEEVEVARRQNEEDLLLYGSRSEPVDAHEIDIHTGIIGSPTQIAATDLESPLDEVKKAHNVEGNSGVNEVNVSVDEHAEDNPLSTWLAQSALPSVIPAGSHPLDQIARTEVDPVKEEIREIEIFRTVHLASGPEINGNAKDTPKADAVLDLELSSQIYHRNIVDRYPLLPTYLARRLAEANSSRAERLSRRRVEAKAKPRYRTADKTTAPNPVNRLKRTYSRPADPIPGEIRKRSNSYASLSKSQPQYEYWTGRGQSQRTKSVGTRSSSRNSSLHGSPKFCYQKQYQNIDYLASSPTYHYSSPGLPPPPVKLRKGHSSKRKAKKLSFDCDICGENVKVDRRRDWQKHVMSDLRPYVCTFQECDRATKPFPSLKKYLVHEIEVHEICVSERSSAGTVRKKREESIVCIFCGERTEAGTGNNSRGRHVGRHMEEIAFTIVPKAYEEWDFYTDSSASKSISCKQAKSHLSKPRDPLPPREATAQDALKHGIPTGYSLKNWDPEEEPIVLLGSVFDANSLGKWIYDWTIFCHGADTHAAVLAGDLWLVLISLAGKMKRIAVVAVNLLRSRNFEVEIMLEDFLRSAERLWDRLKRLLKVCGRYMLKRFKEEGTKKMGKESGRDFVEILFGREKELEATENLARAMRLWIMRFDANCEEVLRGAESPVKRTPSEGSHGASAR